MKKLFLFSFFFLCLSTLSMVKASDFPSSEEESQQKMSLFSRTYSAVSGFLSEKKPSIVKKAVCGLVIAQHLLPVVQAVTCPSEMVWNDFMRENVAGIAGLVFPDELKKHFGQSFLFLNSFQGVCKTTTTLDTTDLLNQYRLQYLYSSSTPLSRETLSLIGATIDITSVTQLVCMYMLGMPGHPQNSINHVNVTCYAPQ